MHDQSMDNQKLIKENALLKQRIQELEISKVECKQENDALRESEERYRILLSESPDPTFSFTPEGQYRYVNSAFAKGVGKPVEDIIGKSIWDVFPKDQADKRFVSLSQVFRTGKEKVIEVRVPREDGDRYYVTTITPIKDTKGEILYAICSSKDITDRKRVEEALHSSEIKFRTLFNSTSDAVMLLDEKNFLDCSKATLAIFGCATREEFCKKHPAELSPSQQPCGTDSIVLANRMIAEAIGRGSIHFEWMHKRNDTGEPFPADVLLTAMEMDGKQVVQAVVRDITERKQAEEKSQNMLNFLQILIDTIPSPIFCKDIHGRYQDCNKEFEGYVGFKKEEIIGKSVYEMHTREVADKYHEMDLALFREPGRQIYEYPIIYADGERHDVVVNKATYLNADGAVAGLVGVMVDITERKRKEEELRASKDLYSFLIRNTSDYVARYSLNGELLFASEGMRFMLGYNPQEIIGTSGFDRVHPDDWSIVKDALKKASKNVHRPDDKLEYRAIHKDGSYLWVELSGKLVLNNQTGQMEIIATVRNVQERKLIEDELRKHHEKLEQFVEERTRDLENKTKALEEVNIALKVLLHHREEDRRELEDKFVMNINNLIIPFAKKMRNTNLDERQLAYMGIIETHLKDITSSMITKFNQLNLTPTEVEVASLIKEGKATKEIAKIMGSATSSIDTHRNNIRKKLGINKENVNLRSYLQSFN